ncbi:M28 family peptidase [Facklamia miroungae]|uniref:PA domain-containing protein n=1 Tax=Facklamia miroungae TaxID=120956 RepID=A0A1G7UWG0_9LACT|nr:M28 family peptidase [Facklamia miroungae]NKZ30153.1 M28 family peptidase [Facklamia miroungae]SDG51935.1 PA domain-containing protein [Facklamia miroungae]
MKLLKKLSCLGLALSLFPLPMVVAEASNPLQKAEEAYLSAVDADYGYQVANQLAEFKSNEQLGYRMAGSQAEHEAGQYLAQEMEKIGLSQVTSDAFSVDAWTFEKAEMTFANVKGQEVTAVLAGYQVNFDTQGLKDFPIVYLNKGTASDYQEAEAKGKFVLIDINQMEEWWVNYPAYEAKLQGAAGVIVIQEAGFGEVSDESLNANDICGPADAPILSISKKDGEQLKAALAANNNEMIVSLDVKSTVELDGQAYNISGRIEGKDKDAYILYSAHYDAYFDGFQDDSAAIGLLLGIAKAMVDSGYQPEKTIIFNALAAEEWGVSNSRYDWSTGAFNQIFRLHPEWQGKAVANINFELPAMGHNDSDQIGSVYEMEAFIKEFAKGKDFPKDLYPEGIEVISPNTTWADDWSFSIAGVPSIRNRFESDFRNTHYHTQFDNKETYNQQAFEHHHNLYGLLGMAIDHQAVAPIDLTQPLKLLKETIAEESFKSVNLDSNLLREAVDQVLPLAKALNEEIQTLNANYLAALEAGQVDQADEIYADSRALNEKVLAAYRFIQDAFVRLTWEDEQKYPHELITNNLIALKASIQSLEKSEGQVALDESLYLVDNNWYAYDFSRETYDYFTNYVLDQSDDRLMWGAGRIVSHVDLFDTIASVKQKVINENPDYKEEITVLEKHVKDQEKLLKDVVEEEISQLQQLQALLK